MTRSRITLALLIAASLSFTGCLEDTNGYPAADSGPHAYMDVNSASFEEVVLNSDQPVMVDFWATWCGPCKQIAPTIAQVADEYDGKVVVAKLDIDEAGDVAERYGITAIPTLIFFKNGEEVTRFNPSGIGQIRDQLDSMLD